MIRRGEVRRVVLLAAVAAVGGVLFALGAVSSLDAERRRERAVEVTAVILETDISSGLALVQYALPEAGEFVSWTGIPRDHRGRDIPVFVDPEDPASPISNRINLFLLTLTALGAFLGLIGVSSSVIEARNVHYSRVLDERGTTIKAQVMRAINVPRLALGPFELRAERYKLLIYWIEASTNKELVFPARIIDPDEPIRPGDTLDVMILPEAPAIHMLLSDTLRHTTHEADSGVVKHDRRGG